MAIKTFLCTVQNGDKISVDASEPNVGGSYISIHRAPAYSTIYVQLSMKDGLKLAEQLIKNARKGEQR
jgi:hypothetical protein